MFHRPLITLVLTLACLPAFAADSGRANPWNPAVDAQLHNGYNSPVQPMLLAKKWDELSPAEKKRVKQAQDRYRKLPRDKKKKLRERWENMPKKERDKYKLEKDYR